MLVTTACQGCFRGIVSRVANRLRDMPKAAGGEKGKGKKETRTKTFNPGTVKKVFWSEENGEEVCYSFRFTQVLHTKFREISSGGIRGYLILMPRPLMEECRIC